MANEWFVKVNGIETGPLTDSELRELARTQGLTPMDLVRKAPSADSVHAARVRGLFLQSPAAGLDAKPAERPITSPTKPLHQATTSNAAPTFVEVNHRDAPYLIPCPDCHRRVSPNAKSCPSCGSELFRPSRALTIVLALVLGSFGAHRFYLRQPGLGVVYLLFFWTYIPGIVGFIEGLRYVFMDEEQFIYTYGWPANRYECDDSSKVVRKLTRVTGTFLLALIGGILMMSFPLALFSEPERWAGALCAMVVGFCLFPFGWKWLSRHFEFLKRHALETRVILGMGAGLFLALVDTYPTIRSATYNYDSGDDISIVRAEGSNSITSNLSNSTYSVIEAKALAGNKKSFAVRLNQRTSEEELRAIATRLKNSDPRRYRLIHVAFYLPGMEVDTFAWAIAQFKPNFKNRHNWPLH